VLRHSKELHLAEKKMTPPWPNKAFNLEHKACHVAFSPSGSHLAFGAHAAHTTQANKPFMFGIDGASKPSSQVTPKTSTAWNVRLMGSVWRQEVETDRFESGVWDRFMPPIQRLPGKDSRQHHNKPTHFFCMAALSGNKLVMVGGSML
jgi:hypothetical protein